MQTSPPNIWWDTPISRRGVNAWIDTTNTSPHTLHSHLLDRVKPCRQTASSSLYSYVGWKARRTSLQWLFQVNSVTPPVMSWLRHSTVLRYKMYILWYSFLVFFNHKMSLFTVWGSLLMNVMHFVVLYHWTNAHNNNNNKYGGWKNQSI